MNQILITPPTTVERKCKIEEMFDSNFLELLRLVPRNTLVRALILKLTGKMPGPDCTSFDQVKDWVEFNCQKRPRATCSNSGSRRVLNDGIAISVDFSETEYGRADYSVRRSGSEEFRIGAADLMDMVQEAIDAGGGIDEVVEIVAGKIDDDAWDQCDPGMDNYGEYDYDDFEADDTGDSEIDYSKPKSRTPWSPSCGNGIPNWRRNCKERKTMKLIKINKAQVSEAREVPGLLNCRIEYEVKSAKGQVEYSGPKFAPEMWHQVLSFFRWTHKEHQSECQVRLYVNYRLGRWGAWAFLQAARTGMSARELPEPETPEKAKERFASWNSEPSDDWLYFGTVHHHCSASAFQSSTDEQNEWNQDGLHLTMGRMDAERHDLHARLYLDGNCFEPDMSRFWPVDPELAAKVPTSMHSELARFQMSEKVTVDFPDAWRKNLVEVKRESLPQRPPESWGLEQPEWGERLGARVDDALEEIHARCVSRGIGDEQWLAELHALSADGVTQVVIEACLTHGVTPEEILAESEQFTFGY